MAATVLQSNQATGNSSSPSVSITVPSGSDMIVLVALWVTGDQVPTAAGAIGGESQSAIYSSGSLHIYRTVAPAAGATTAAFTLASAADWSMHVAVLGDVDQSLLTGTPVAGTNDSETTVGASVTLGADDLAFAFGFMPTQTMSVSVGALVGSANLAIQGGWRSSAIGSNTGTGSVGVTFTTGESFGDNYAVVVPVFGTASSIPAPSIDDVDGDDDITSTQTGWAVNGSDFDDATVEIRQGAVEIAQTVTGQTATAITCSTVFDAGVGPHLKYGSATLAVINGDAQDDTIAIGILAPSGRSFVDLTTPNPTAANRITAVPDLASGDQLEIRNVQGGTIADVNVNSDATFDVDEAVTAFDVRAWDSSDQAWGSVGTQTVGDIPPPPEPPVFDGTIPNRSFVVDVAITSWDLSTYFTGATSYSSAGTLPTGLTLNSSTGVLSGTPSATGTYSGITITGINDDGMDTSNAFTITITDTPPPPTPTKPRRRDGRRRGLLGYIYGRG